MPEFYFGGDPQGFWFRSKELEEKFIYQPLQIGRQHGAEFRSNHPLR
jgi:hypothetical protein